MTLLQRDMRESFAVSALLHGALILAASIAWPHWIDPLPTDATMSVELVQLADESRAPKPAPPAPKVEPQEVEKPPEPVRQDPPPPPTEVKPLVPLPPMPQELPKLQPPPLPAPTPLPKLAIAPKDTPRLEKVDLKKALPELPKDHAKVKPVKAPDPPKEVFDPTKIASTLNKIEKKSDAPTPPTPSPAQQTASLEGGLTMSEKDALRAMIGRNWNVPTGAPRPEDLVVIVRFQLNPDGTLIGAPQLVNAGSYASNSFFRAAADSALRAVQMTQPFKLPPAKYNEWRSVTLTFDPRDMAGLR